MLQLANQEARMADNQANADIGERIAAANAVFMAAFKRGDAAGMTKAYTADALLAPPHSDFVRGAEAIQRFWTGVITLGLRDLELETAEIEVHGELAVETGRYTLRTPDGATADRGKYLVVWQNERGAWKLRRDIWTTSQPAAGD
jgi:uncharacterized protein (TIGR02246 family)